MSKDGISTSSRPIRDGSASGGLLSKASSSIKRSPSKRHRSHPSNPLPSLEQIFHEPPKSRPSEHALFPKRPDVYRTHTTPYDAKSSYKDSKAPKSAIETAIFGASFGNNHVKDAPATLNKGATATVAQNSDHLRFVAMVGDASYPAAAYVSGSQNPNILYQHIYDMTSKRISTLDYFRKAHEGRVFWFNTVHFSRSDLSKFPNFSSAKLSRRATNYLLLGLSIPPVLDVHPQNHPAASAAANATAANDFLKTLNALLLEFETYQQNHPPDGSTASTLSRTRIPHMFKRATQVTSSRTRRTSSSAGPEIGLPMQQTSSHPSEPQRHLSNSSITTSSLDTNNYYNHNNLSTHQSNSSNPNISSNPPSSSTPTNPSLPTTTTSTFPSFPHPSLNPLYLDLPNSTLSPTETTYTHLLTPPLPFPPDFHTVFATLCDVLIDAYSRVQALINSPAVCAHGSQVGLGEMFAKADARLRKVIVGGVVREFEAAAREGGKREVLGVQRVVLGGLMGG